MARHPHTARLYVPCSLAEGAVITLGPEQSHHLQTVLRAKKDDAIRVFNADSGEWLGIIQHCDKKKGLSLLLQERLRPPETSPAPLYLFCPILRPHVMHWLLEKACELGASDIIPTRMQHSQHPHYSEEKWQTILQQAAEQCERLSLPRLHAALPLRDAVDYAAANDIRLWCAIERMEALPLPQLSASSTRPLGIMIGPEGGFSPEEKAWLSTHASITPAHLGPRILRAETAALVMLSYAAARDYNG